MAQFDPNQSSIEYGESLLASQEARRKKARKRQKKIKRFQYALGTIGVADMFLNRKAQERLKSFSANLKDQEANALNRLTNATKFRDN